MERNSASIFELLFLCFDSRGREFTFACSLSEGRLSTLKVELTDTELSKAIFLLAKVLSIIRDRSQTQVALLIMNFRLTDERLV